ncbi:hypothetical protein BJL95_05315 [Methylomonas sp. LWB]|uniref:DUF3526 domain-containing protein n=1 Tax=Methylomonas sp. LWB TaxID=1905845 RepID=UPI0008DA8DC8|nr:DUF3526 domain-containing protein [Methylomonas sp. LWB]OHX37445.1 hypothetical protein BJL95_05315 [Methylomonas sp. LWB]
MKSLSLCRIECRQLRHDRVFWATSLLCAAALLFGFNNGRQWQTGQDALIAEYAQQSRQDFEELLNMAKELRAKNQPPAKTVAERERDPRYALTLGGMAQHICRQNGDLAALTVGQTDLYNACILVNAWEVGGAYDERLHRTLENPLRLLFGRFDAAFAILTLLPIAILLLTYNQLSAERELGTLALLGCQPVPPRRIIAARFAVRAAWFVALTLLPLSLALWLAEPPADVPSFVAAWGGWLLLSSVYLWFWFACAFWINSRGNGSAENGLLLAGLWLFLVVVLPGCLNLGLKQWYPLPSRMAFIDASREATIEVGKRKSELLGKYLIDHPDRVPQTRSVNVDDYIQTRLALDEETQRVLAPGRAEFTAQQGRQLQLVERLGFLSPAIVYQHAVQQLTGQGQDYQQAFLEAVAEYHQRLRAFYFPKFVQDGPEFSDYQAIPQFRHPPPADAFRRSNLLAACVGVGLPSLLLVVAGWRNMRRIRFKVGA